MRVPKLTGAKGGAVIAKSRQVEIPRARTSSLEAAFRTLWMSLPQTQQMRFPETEFLFAESIERKWRFDFAWPERLVAVELEGTTRDRTGRHQQAAGYTADCEKYNAAVLLGWAVLRYTTIDIAQRPVQVIEEVQRLLVGRKK